MWYDIWVIIGFFIIGILDLVGGIIGREVVECLLLILLSWDDVDGWWLWEDGWCVGGRVKLVMFGWFVGLLWGVGDVGIVFLLENGEINFVLYMC